MSTTLREAAGSLLVVGLNGPELTGLERAWLKLIRPAGLIFFRRNIKDIAQTRSLLDEAAAFCRPNPARFVDVEGGTVNRLRDALSPIASAQAVAEAARTAEKPALARKHGEVIARAVKAFGFNATLAPVVDLALPEAAEVLGSRTTGSTARDVISYAREFFSGLKSEGIVGCGKHYPGLGGAAGDTHFITPAIERTFDQLWSEDLVPYRELHKQMPIIMTNHAAYPKAPGKKEPASASRFWITEMLRKRIGYKGIIFSDDLEMGGILKFLPAEEAAVAAIRAGTDLIEICHSTEVILRSYEGLISEAERSSAFRKLLLATARDSSRKRARLLPRKISSIPTAKAFESLRCAIAQLNESVARITQASADAAPRASSPAEAT